MHLPEDKSYEEENFLYFEENPYPNLDSVRLGWWNNDHMMATYKCIGSIIPRAQNAIFKVNNLGDFVYYDKKSDAPRPEDEYGHIETNLGDSGSPYVYEEDGVSYLMAIHSNGIDTNEFIPRGYHNNDPQLRCTGIATKITDDIINWTKKLGRI